MKFSIFSSHRIHQNAVFPHQKLQKFLRGGGYPLLAPHPLGVFGVSTRLRREDLASLIVYLKWRPCPHHSPVQHLAVCTGMIRTSAAQSQPPNSSPLQFLDLTNFYQCCCSWCRNYLNIIINRCGHNYRLCHQINVIYRLIGIRKEILFAQHWLLDPILCVFYAITQNNLAFNDRLYLTIIWHLPNTDLLKVKPKLKLKCIAICVACIIH